MTELEQEKLSLILQISELYQIIDLTQQNLTNTIHQVMNSEDFRLRLTILFLALKQKSAFTRTGYCIRTAFTNS